MLTQSREVQGEIRLTSPRYACLAQPKALSVAEIQQLLDNDTLLISYSLGEERSYVWGITPEAVTTFELPAQSEITRAARRVYDLVIERTRRVSRQTYAQQRRRIERADQEYPEAAAALSLRYEVVSKYESAST